MTDQRTLQGLLDKLKRIETFEDRVSPLCLELLEYIPLLEETVAVLADARTRMEKLKDR